MTKPLKPPPATLVADDLLAENAPNDFNELDPPKTGKNRQTEKPGKLVWEAVNPITWRLINPDGPRIEVPRSHGQWPGFYTPRALAWVFDVGASRGDWRIRVRKRGGWQAFGCIVDVELAKRIAHSAVEGAP